VKARLFAVLLCVPVLAGCSAPRDFVSTPWKLIRKSQSNTVYALALSGGCIRFEKFEVDERPNQVILTAFSKDLAFAAPTPAPGEPGLGCSADLQLNAVAVCLRAPLADRPLTHAPISARWDGPNGDDYVIPPAIHEPKPCPRS
jgi:hypothetical protein